MSPRNVTVRPDEHRAVGFDAIGACPKLLGIANAAAFADGVAVQRDLERRSGRSRRFEPSLASWSGEERVTRTDQVVCRYALSHAFEPHVRSATSGSRAGNVIGHRVRSLWQLGPVRSDCGGRIRRSEDHAKLVMEF